MKIALLQNTAVELNEAAQILTDALDAEFVQGIGSKLTLYRPAKEDPVIVLE
ncbi:MAG: hypothetical protein ACLVLI_05085 [Aedoeadaptatus pacaensis]